MLCVRVTPEVEARKVQHVRHAVGADKAPDAAFDDWRPAWRLSSGGASPRQRRRHQRLRLPLSNELVSLLQQMRLTGCWKRMRAMGMSSCSAHSCYCVSTAATTAMHFKGGSSVCHRAHRICELFRRRLCRRSPLADEVSNAKNKAGLHDVVVFVLQEISRMQLATWAKCGPELSECSCRIGDGELQLAAEPLRDRGGYRGHLLP